MIREIELNDEGSIICKYDDVTGEIEELCTWNGGEVGHRWERIARETVDELMAEEASAKGVELCKD